MNENKGTDLRLTEGEMNRLIEKSPEIQRKLKQIHDRLLEMALNEK